MIAYVILTLIVVALVGVAIWWFVFRKKAETAAAQQSQFFVPQQQMPQMQQNIQQEHVPGYSVPTGHAYGREAQQYGAAVTAPGIYETEQILQEIHSRPRPILDMVPDSARHQATNFRGEIPVAPRTDNGILRPLNAEIEAENRYGYGNGIMWS